MSEPEFNPLEFIEGHSLDLPPVEIGGISSREMFALNSLAMAGSLSVDGLGALQHEAQRDSVTGLYNKRTFLRKANELFEQTDQTDEEVHYGILFIDLGNFSEVNNRLEGGHKKGDEVLRETAGLLAAKTRSEIGYEDIQTRGDRHDEDPGRVGGDEFALLVRLVGREEKKTELEPLERLQRVRHRLLEEYLEPYLATRPELQSVNFTFTIGIALRRPEESIEEVLERADDDMYLRKSEELRELTPEEEADFHIAAEALERAGISAREFGKRVDVRRRQRGAG